MKYKIESNIQKCIFYNKILKDYEKMWKKIINLSLSYWWYINKIIAMIWDIIIYFNTNIKSQETYLK